MVWLKELYSITREYWGHIIFLAIFVLALLIILIWEKEKIKRYAFLWYSCLVLAFIYNPVSFYVCKHFLEPSTFDQYYKRFFTLVPITIIVAFALTLLVSRLTGVKRLAAVLAGCIAIAVIGKCIYLEDWYTKADNRNKVPQDVVTICDIFADYEGDKINIMAPQDIAVYLRQMDSRFSMPYSRYLPEEAYELTNESPDTQLISDYCVSKKLDFLIVSAAEGVLEAYEKAGFEVYGRTPYYAVLNPPNTAWELMEYEDESGDQGLCYFMHNKMDGSLIVIDGGHKENAGLVRYIINQYGGHVDAWILTHYHKDHVDAFNEIYEDPQGITIDNVYATPLDADVFHSVAQEWDDVDSYDKFMELTKGADNVNYIHRDDILEFSDNLKLTFFNACDDVVIDSAEDIPNDASLVFKMETENRSILICGDCHTKYMGDYLVETYGDKLHADILQCGHHGNNSIPFDTGFYEAVDPQIAIFDTPEWIMTSANYTAGALAGQLKEMGVEIRYYNTSPNGFRF
ncbi:hypothetical protein CSX01_01175 [Pseudobutyrivibrio ruminis]|uniref:Metallo-beta-lactamase domain-containing protein n=1 Tax=Pseudobutyrivibrio ruminis TaxID=46206 RepID=A0A2G3DYW7_9FIRM|nr:hypothetical protein CSX01_01175 [Pseudobutyrivibrio ruminis]